jgi:hypothetical protein
MKTMDTKLGGLMSAQQDINLWEFLESGNFHSSENLKILSHVLLEEKGTFMREYNAWFDDLPEHEDDGEDAYYSCLDREEKEYQQSLLNL